MEDGMHYEGNCIRPPPEANSILLQVTLGCSHNKCTFCGTYQDKPFRIKNDKIILGDILFAARHMRQTDRLFLMDGDALIIPQKRLLWILKRIREHLPQVKGVGSYANTKSIDMKSERELDQLRENGLDSLYLGVESGDDIVRQQIRKGSTANHCLQMGLKAKRAGMKLLVLVLLGIAGPRSRQHAQTTGKLLSEMNPDQASALTIIPIEGTPFYEQLQKGKIQLPDEHGFLMEMRAMLAHTNLDGGVFASSHPSNYLSICAHLPQEKQAALDRIDAALRGEIGLKPEWQRAF